MFIEVLPEDVPSYLETISRSGILASFYMAGGTGLALQLGHRRSVDLDFFTKRPFDPSETAKKISYIGNFSIESKSQGTLHGLFHNVKLSLFHYSYSLLKNLHPFMGLQIADAIDIGCMKIDAISSRGYMRDFIDLYVICNEVVSLKELLVFFEKKYKGVSYNKVHIMKSLIYFEEAEQEPLPKMLKKIEWNDVKTFFIDHVKTDMNKLLK
ncbi:MAG: nucleotidyl transferase AbiEii/AbiGii toxin family protein [Nitrospirota bacterium]